MNAQRGYGGPIVVPPGVMVGIAPDPATAQDTRAVVAAILRGGFVYSGPNRDDTELYFQRFCDAFVDLMVLTTIPDTKSLAQRFERRGFPWPKEERPDPLTIAYGPIDDVVRQALEWSAA